MRAFTLRKLLGVFATLFVASTASRAITIDDFEDPVDGPKILSDAPSYHSASGAMGGARFVRILGGEDTYGKVRAGAFHLVNGAGATGDAVVEWHGTGFDQANTTGLGNVDLLQDNPGNFIIRIRSFDSPYYQSAKPIQLKIRVFNGNDPTRKEFSWASVYLKDPISGGKDILVPLSSFIQYNDNAPATTPRASDLAHAGAVSLALCTGGSGCTTPTPDVDISVDWFGTDGQCAILPNTVGKVIDECKVCGGDGSSCKDCMGVPNGAATVGTACSTGLLGECAPGTWVQSVSGAACSCSGKQPTPQRCDSKDNDCDGVIDGQQFPGVGAPCGNGSGACAVSGTFVCGDDGGIRCSADTQSGQVQLCIQSLGCDGVPNSGLVLDVCGRCGGDGSSCRDCAGVVNGSAKFDRCGTCNGDGNKCLGCESRDVTALLAELDGGAKLQESVIRGIAYQVKAVKKDAKTQAKIRAILKEVHRLQIRNWVLSWIVPQVSTQCTNTIFCVSSSNDQTINEYRVHARELELIGQRLADTLRIARGGKLKARDKLLVKKNTEVYKHNIELTKQVPRIQSSCSGS